MPPRFGDMDPIGHLNNVALARFYEDGRVRFMNGIGVWAALEPGCGFVVAEIAIHYLAEGRYPQVVTAASGLIRLGRSSLTIGQALFQDGPLHRHGGGDAGLCPPQGRGRACAPRRRARSAPGLQPRPGAAT